MDHRSPTTRKEGYHIIEGVVKTVLGRDKPLTTRRYRKPRESSTRRDPCDMSTPGLMPGREFYPVGILQRETTPKLSQNGISLSLFRTFRMKTTGGSALAVPKQDRRRTLQKSLLPNKEQKKRNNST